MLHHRAVAKPLPLRTHLHAATIEFIIYYHQWFTPNPHSTLCRKQVKCSNGSVI